MDTEASRGNAEGDQYPQQLPAAWRWRQIGRITVCCQPPARR
jgi:hypothetical protein